MALMNEKQKQKQKKKKAKGKGKKEKTHLPLLSSHKCKVDKVIRVD